MRDKIKENLYNDEINLSTFDFEVNNILLRKNKNDLNLLLSLFKTEGLIVSSDTEDKLHLLLHAIEYYYTLFGEDIYMSYFLNSFLNEEDCKNTYAKTILKRMLNHPNISKRIVSFSEKLNQKEKIYFDELTYCN